MLTDAIVHICTYPDKDVEEEAEGLHEVPVASAVTQHVYPGGQNINRSDEFFKIPL